LTFADAAERVSDGESGHSQVAITDLGKVPAERPHPKAAYSSCRSPLRTFGGQLAAFELPWRQGDGVACVLGPKLVVGWCGRAPACHQHVRA
jgi:hypothetical protein